MLPPTLPAIVSPGRRSSLAPALGLPAESAASAAQAQPGIGVRSRAVLTVDGRGSRTSTPTASSTVRRLAQAGRRPGRRPRRRMTLEEKAGLMLIDTVNASCDPATGEFGTVPACRRLHRHAADAPPHLPQRRRQAARMPVTAGGGGFATNVRVTPAEAATFMNSIQELSEATRLGIPVLYKSNARNHIDPQARAGINEARRRVLGVPEGGRHRRGRPRRAGEATVRRPTATCRSSRTSPRSWARSGRRSACAACTATWPTCRPTRAGTARTRPSPRTPTWARTSWASS